jgi:hypothetical protein
MGLHFSVFFLLCIVYYSIVVDIMGDTDTDIAPQHHTLLIQYGAVTHWSVWHTRYVMHSWKTKR